jgi:hypothetical protein
MGEGNLHREENTSKHWLKNAIIMLPSLSKSETWVQLPDYLKAILWKFIGMNPGFHSGLGG